MTEFPPLPYITASMLNRYKNRTVRILGRVSQQASDNSRFTLETVDGAVVTVLRPQPTAVKTGWACVTGVVDADMLALRENVVDWIEGDVDSGLAKAVILSMQKLPALFAV